MISFLIIHSAEQLLVFRKPTQPPAFQAIRPVVAWNFWPCVRILAVSTNFRLWLCWPGLIYVHNVVMTRVVSIPSGKVDQAVILGLYWGGSGFGSQNGHRLSWLIFFVILLIPSKPNSGKIPGIRPRLLRIMSFPLHYTPSCYRLVLSILS
jgi:hypothetical protein